MNGLAMSLPTDRTEYLFSYGTLGLEPVQIATFGRKLDRAPDRLPGHRLAPLEVPDAALVPTRGMTHPAMLVLRGQPRDVVDGTVFAITPEELRHADAYEVADYRRERITLASGLSAWVYVDARPAAGTA